MFGMRTPPARQTKNRKSEEDITKETETVQNNQRSSVRRSIGEWESGKTDPLATSTSPKKASTVEPPKTKTVPSTDSGNDIRPIPRRASVEAAGSPPKQEKMKYNDRVSEARACVQKAKLNLGNSRNIKTEIKAEVTKAIERLYQLVKEADNVKGQKVKEQEKEANLEEVERQGKSEKERERDDSELIKRIEEHTKLMMENTERMEKLKGTLEKYQEIQEIQEKRTYASVAAALTGTLPVERTALHSVVVTAKDETLTGGEVLDRIREAVNAKEGGVIVERIRKAKDQKIIVSCRTMEEREKLKDRLKGASQILNFEEMANKNPLVIIKDVLKFNTDEDILNSLIKQNRDVFTGVEINTKTFEIAYKKATRNPHTHHVVVRVSPAIWKRMVDAGFIRIDLQRVRVADQSPLVQCSLCLGYGHGRRFCRERQEKCSHCGGPHMRAACEELLAHAPPVCCNCALAKVEDTTHDAFSRTCTVRRRWDALARATIAYC